MGGSAGHCRGIWPGKTTAAEITPRASDAAAGEIHYENVPLWHERGRPPSLAATEWGVVHQHPLDGLRQVSAGGNIGERLMATGTSLWRYSRHRAEVAEDVEIPANRIDDLPTTFPAACSSVCRLPATVTASEAGVYG